MMWVEPARLFTIKTWNNNIFLSVNEGQNNKNPTASHRIKLNCIYFAFESSPFVSANRITPFNFLTLKATGSVLLHRQWEGRTEQRKLGLSVRTSSAGWSAMISAMLRFSWGRSLGTAAAASGCPAGELTSFIFPGTGWRLLDGGLNLRLALGSTGIRITTAGIIRKGTKDSPAPLSFSHTLGEKLGVCSAVNFSASANGKWDSVSAQRVSQLYWAPLNDIKIYLSRKKTQALKTRWCFTSQVF